jgi:hypothetical protein
MLICGGLENGRDGVGDYCRRLAGELASLGHECVLVAYNDHHVLSETTEVLRPTIRIVRLPESASMRERAAQLSAVLHEWRPDWVSLQFVSYAFNRKGIPLEELVMFPRLFRALKVHVMLHELWVGLGVTASPRNSILGTLQSWVVTLLLRRLRPAVIHTSNHYYRQILARHGVDAETLPLFGNIGVTSASAGHWLAKALILNGGPDVSLLRSGFWLFALFGDIPAGWSPQHLFERLSAIARAAGRRAIVASVGVAGSAATTLFAESRAVHPDMDFVTIGPRSAGEISQFFNSSDFGITPHPLYLLGKSGSAAAMLEHGLPLIATWGDIAPELPAINPPFESLIWRDDGTLSERLQTAYTRHRRPDWCATVTEMFLSSLSKAASTIR